jgi:hypothetical protein
MFNQGELSSHVHNARTAHTILYGVSVGLFALAALLLRVLRFKSTVRIHYSIQIVATIIMFSGFGCGVWLTQNGDGVRQSTTASCPVHIARSLARAHEWVGELN